MYKLTTITAPRTEGAESHRVKKKSRMEEGESVVTWMIQISFGFTSILPNSVVIIKVPFWGTAINRDVNWTVTIESNQTVSIEINDTVNWGVPKDKSDLIHLKYTVKWLNGSTGLSCNYYSNAKLLTKCN